MLDWKEYKLLDSGNGHRLEQWGEYLLIRPETVAIWKPKQSLKEWMKSAHAIFEFNSKRTGTWRKLKNIPNEWTLIFPLGAKQLQFSIELTRFKHVGLFPEQASNWLYIQEKLKDRKDAKVLNLFAYTGGATLAAKAAGASVTHVDAIKQVISWSNKNMKLSNLEDIRWIVDDALKFVQKELKRGNKYDMIILDPPTWGLGPKGEKWKIEEKLDELLNVVSKVVLDDGVVVINTYSGLTPMMMKNICMNYFPRARIKATELMLESRTSFNIPTGTVVHIEM